VPVSFLTSQLPLSVTQASLSDSHVIDKSILQVPGIQHLQDALQVGAVAILYFGVGA